MTGVRSMLTLAVGFAAAGCAYSNAMWSAQHHAGEARRLEQRGQPSEAHAEWTLAAAKARAVMARHPHGRRADDALMLQAEALARSGACQDAAEPLARARERVSDGDGRERLALAAAECALALGRPEEAEAALAIPLASRDADRRSQAEYLAGEAAALRMEWDTASRHFNRSSVPAARGRAAVTQQRVLIAQSSDPSELTPVVAECTRLLRGEPGTDEATHLLALLNQVMASPEPPAARFHAAEVARDSLGAPALAGAMFLAAAARDTASLYAPKALIAALVLLPARRDSIVALLDSRYAGSPYTRAFHGEASVAYAAAEDSLARELGVTTIRNAAVPRAVLFGVPLPGPRGPPPPPLP